MFFIEYVFAVRLVFGIEPIRRGCAYEANEQALKITYRNHNARVMQVFVSVKIKKQS